MFKYSKYPQYAHELAISSLKHSLMSLPSCWISILFGVLYCLIILVEKQLLHVNTVSNFSITVSIVLDIALITPVLIVYFVQLQGYADNIKYDFKDFIQIVPKKFPMLFFTQVIAFVFILFAANISPILVPFVMFPLFIIVPVTIFMSNDHVSALKKSWVYVSGNRFFILCSVFFIMCFYRVFILMFTSATSSPIMYVIVFAFLIANFAAFSLNLLHNVILRHELKLMQNSSEAQA